MSKIKEAKEQAQGIVDELNEKGGMVGQAIGVSFLVFFFAVFLFIGVVIVFVKLAGRIGPGGGQ